MDILKRLLSRDISFFLEACFLNFDRLVFDKRANCGLVFGKRASLVFDKKAIVLWDMAFGKRTIVAWSLTKGLFHVHKRKIVASLVFDKRIIVAWLLACI